MTEEPQTPQETPAPVFEREQRRLERLRLVAQAWPLPDRFEDPESPPQDAA